MAGDIVPFDLHRMFLGSQPWLFYLEILVRTIIIYSYTFALVRWIGGRSVAQLSIVEFILVIALGSAVGDPLFYPDVPVFHALLAITLVVLINKVIDWVMLTYRGAERRIDGVPVQVVRNGRILVDHASRRNLSPPEIFAQLRLGGIRNLGEVSEAYIEPNGDLSIFRTEPTQPGLPLVPPPEFSGRHRKDTMAPAYCTRCGAGPHDNTTPCEFCGNTEIE
ncbi:DUF421 domain-containing protein [Hyphomonas oceanitis]|uniref:DUF421 domain-containing protein n=1 Tax=Hyphomonas oceanitis TaxID=81033 RepID=UPI0030032F85